MNGHGSTPAMVSVNSLADPSASPRQKLAYALCMSEQMLNAARKGDWATVEFLDEERRRLLTDDLFETEATDAKLLADSISALVSVNKEISLLAEEFQLSLQQQHGHHQSVRQATQSYTAIAGV